MRHSSRGFMSESQHRSVDAKLASILAAEFEQIRNNLDLQIPMK